MEEKNKKRPDNVLSGGSQVNGDGKKVDILAKNATNTTSDNIEDEPDRTIVAAIVGATVGFLVLVAIVVGIVCYMKK